MAEFEYEDRLTITTPEGVELSLTLAGVGSRFVAAIVDALIEGALLAALAVLIFTTDGFGAGGNVAAAIYVVVVFVVFWGYDVAFEVLASGRTPGKRWNGLRVVRTGGQPIGFLASATRNLLRVIDWLPSFYVVGIVAVFVSGKNQRLGDIVAGTVVMRERRSARSPAAAVPFASWPEDAGSAEIGAWDVSAITPDELATVRSFLERRNEIAAGARYELAATISARLRPKVAGVPDTIQAERFLEQLVQVKSARG